MLTSLFHESTFSVAAVIMTLTAALLMGVVIALIYRLSSPDAGRFAVTLALMPALIASVIMIVNGNLGASVAVLGAFGLVRFRSAPGTAREIMFIFYSMAAGLAAGMGFLTLGAILTALIGAALIVFDKAGLGDKEEREKELRVMIPEGLDCEDLFDDLLMQYTKRARLEKVRTTNLGTMYELIYRLEMRRDNEEKAFIDEVRCRNGNLTVALGRIQRERNEW